MFVYVIFRKDNLLKEKGVIVLLNEWLNRKYSNISNFFIIVSESSNSWLKAFKSRAQELLSFLVFSRIDAIRGQKIVDPENCRKTLLYPFQKSDGLSFGWIFEKAEK
jgi:hypothetical protein